MPSIADLFISVSSDVSGAITGLTAVDEKVNGTTTAMQSAVPAALALGAAAGAVGAGFLNSIQTAQDFEHEINGIKSVMSPDDVNTYGQAIEDLALKLGKDTVFSASQAADAIQEMIKAGVPLPAILGGAAQSALDLAAATGVSVTEAAGLASTAMNTYHLSAEALPGIMDTISNVSNSTATSVGELRFALAAVGPVAAGIGLNFSDTATALGIFANNGLQGSDAGTSLKTMLLNLEPSTKSQVAAFQQLGLITADGTNQFFDASGAAKSMRDIFEILRNSTANLTNEQKINLLQTAFGTDAVRAATIAANEGAQGWDNVATAMAAQGGTAVAAAQRNQGLTGAMNQMNGSIETIQITIGNMFLPILTQLVNGITAVLNGFLTLDPTIQTIITAVLGAVGAVAGLAAGWVLLGPVISSIGAAFGILLPIILSIAGPLAAIGIAAGLLYAAWQDNFGGIRDVTAQVWAAIQPAFQNIKDFIQTIAETLGPAFQNASNGAGPLIEQLSANLKPILAQIPDLVRQAGDQFNRMGTFLGEVADAVRFLVTGDFAAFTRLLENPDTMGFVETLINLKLAFDQIGPVVEMVSQAINFLITGNIDRLVELMQEGLPQPFAAALQFIHDVLATQIQVWKDVLGGIVEFVGYLSSGDLQGAWNSIVNTVGKIKDDIEPLWNEFLLVLGNLLAALPGFIADRAGDLWSGFLKLWASLPNLLGPVWSAFLSWFGGLLGALPQFVGDAVGDIWAALRAAFDGLPGMLGPAWDAFAGWFGGVLSGLPQFVADGMGFVFQALLTVFGNLVSDLAPYWDGFAQWFGSVLGGIPQFVIDHMGDVFGGLVGAFAGLVDLLSPLWDAFAGWFLGVLSGLPQFVIDNMGDVFGGVVAAASDLVGRVAGALDPLRELLANTLGNIGSWVASGGTATPGAGGTGGTATPPVIGGGAGGPIVSIGSITISSEAELQNFLDLVAQAVLASANRVTPPVAGGNPVLG